MARKEGRVTTPNNSVDHAGAWTQADPEFMDGPGQPWASTNVHMAPGVALPAYLLYR